MNDIDTNDPKTVGALIDIKACPHCQKSLVGDEIEPTRREFFAGRTHYSRLVEFTFPDGDTHYQCPHCHERVDP